MSSSSTAQSQKPKGILKAPSQSFPSPEQQRQQQQPAGDKTPSAREIATQHARIIHQRRELEDKVADFIIDLAQFPPAHAEEQGGEEGKKASIYTASNPHPGDVAVFKSMIRLFQPSDLDDLIEERNCHSRCGYGLCYNPPSKAFGGAGRQGTGAWKLVGYGTRDFNIVPRKELEKWCSQACARRAMFIKVQLNETAAWERAGIPSIQIDLLDEPKLETQTQQQQQQQLLADDLEKLKLTEQVEVDQKAARDTADLAAERGDSVSKDDSKKAGRRVPVTIKERTVIMAPSEPSTKAGDDDHLILDGYKIKFDPNSDTVHDVKDLGIVEDNDGDDDGDTTTATTNKEAGEKA